MKVHHLNCGTLRPVSGTLVSHVLLLEAKDGLVLVDTGIGLGDIADPGGRLGAVRHVMRPALDPEETVLRQVERLGFAAGDVRHVVLTHADLDHVGGLSDFPEATVHMTRDEAQALRRPSLRERGRYRAAQWAHGPKIVERDRGTAEWHGLPGAQPLDKVAEGLVMIPLPGHSRGHAGYAVRTSGGWILHAGDTFYRRPQLEGTHTPPMTRILSSLLAADRRELARSLGRVAHLHATQGGEVTVICTHDPSMFQRMASAGR